MGFKHDDETILEIGRLWNEGYGEIRIARMVKVPLPTVRNILRGQTAKSRELLGGRLSQGRRKKVKPHDSHRPFGRPMLPTAVSDKEVELIWQMKEKGYSGAAIGRKIGRSTSTVNKYIKRHQQSQDS